MKTAQEIRRTTGGYLSGTLLLEVPGVRAAFAELLARVQELSFVPAAWTADVQAAMSEAIAGSMWQPAPAIDTHAWAAKKTEPLYSDMPSWITSDQQACVAWNTLCDWWQQRMQPILAGWAHDGASVVKAAAADAVFWNGLYAIVKPIAVVGDVIIEAPEMVGNVVSKMTLGALRGFAPVLVLAAIAGVGYVLWTTGTYKKLLPK
jgi:hypothetical protein